MDGAPARIGPPRTADRRVRLRRRRPDGPARAAGAAAARGLRVSRGHRAVPLRRTLTRGDRALRGGDRRGALAPPRQAAGRRVQLGRLLGAARPERAHAADDARAGRARRRAARGDAGGGRHAQRAHRAAGDAGDRGQRRLRAGGGHGRSARDAARGRVPDARGDHPGRRAVRRAGGRDRAHGVRAAARARAWTR